MKNNTSDKNIIQHSTDIKDKLKDIKEFYTKMSSLYSLRNDLIEVTDKRYSLEHKLNEHLNTNTQNYIKLFDQMSSNLNEIKNIIQSSEENLENIELAHANIQEFDKFINEEVGGEPRINLLNQLLSDESLKKLKEQSNQIDTDWKNLYQHSQDESDEPINILEQTSNASDRILKIHNEMFEPQGTETKSKATILYMHIQQIEDAYAKIVRGKISLNDNNEEVHIKSYIDEIAEKKELANNTISELTAFHQQIYGNTENIGLKKRARN